MTTQPLAPQDLDLSQFEGATPGPWQTDCDGEVRNTSGDEVISIGNYGETIYFGTNADKALVLAAPALLAEVIRLRAEGAKDARDAARYRYVRDFPPRARARKDHVVWPPQPGDLWVSGFKLTGAIPEADIVEGAELDRRIDAALAAPHPSTAASEAAGAGE